MRNETHSGETRGVALLLGVDGRTVGRIEHVESEEHLRKTGAGHVSVTYCFEGAARRKKRILSSMKF